MGEIAEMMLDGTLCEGCGVLIGHGDGYQQYCSAECNPDHEEKDDRFFVMTERKNAQIAFKHWLRRKGVDCYDDSAKDKRGNPLIRFYNEHDQKVGVAVCLCDKALHNAHEELNAYFGDDE